MQTCKVDRYGMFNGYSTGTQQAHDVKQRRIDVDATQWRRGGFPLNISPFTTVQNSSKIIHSQNQATHTIFTKVFYLKDLPLLI